MDTPHASAGRNSEDVLKVLGRVADAFDNPGSLHKMDEDVLFVVNVVKSRRLLPSLSSGESVCQDTTYGSYDSSFDSGYDEDVQVVELGDVSRWAHASSYPYGCRHPSQRSFSDRAFRQEDGMYDITKMLLTSSPLDRLDRLARTELKKTGWFERTDKWSVVELGLQGVPMPATPPKTPSKNAGGSRASSSKTTPPHAEKHASRRTRRGHGHENEQQMKPTLLQSPADSQETDSCLVDFSTLSYADTSHRDSATRCSRTLLDAQGARQQSGGRFRRAVRNLVKRMLPPPSGGRPRHGRAPGRTWRAEMTPRSDASGESRWTFASAGSCEGGSRWSGFWHS